MAKKSTTRRTSERLRRNDPDREAPLRRATRIMLSANNQNDKKTSDGPAPRISESLQRAISSMVQQSPLSSRNKSKPDAAPRSACATA